MQLADILDELYAGLPETFVATRNDRARSAREAGHTSLAEEVGKLPKPSAAAWVLNMLVRHRRDEIDRALQLGATLRRAQQNLDSEQLRRLSRQRRERVAGVVAVGQALAGELGRPISAAAVAEVEQTLHAAMADPQAAASVLGGRLTRALSSVGWGSAESAAAVPDPPTAKNQARSGKEPEAGRRREELASAKRTSANAERKRKSVEAQLVEIRQRIDELSTRNTTVESELTALQDRIGDLKQERRNIEDQSRFLAREHERLADAADHARRDAGRARKRLDRLGQSRPQR
ncbi:MAG: hypothetical protein ABI255_11610 [Microbacteriaceae bacterium]